MKINAGVPHIMIPEEDCITFEWWDGDFQKTNLTGIFESFTATRVGPDKLEKR